MNKSRGYIGFYAGKQVKIRATSMLDAKNKAVAHFKPPKKREHMVSVVLATDDDDKPVVHTPDF